MLMSPLLIENMNHSKVHSELAATTTLPEDELQKQFAFPVFLAQQFNVYYLSWLKNSNHLSQYFERFSLFFKKLHKLPEFWEHSGSRGLSKWVFCKSYKGAMLYQRKLLIQLNTLNATHCSSEKQFKVLLTFDGNANDDHGNEENLPKDSNGRIIFGNLEMKEGAKFSLSLPISFNQKKPDFKLILALVDAENDEHSTTEYHQLVITESSISGFKGYQITEDFQIGENSSLVPIKVNLSVEWQIDVNSFGELAPEASMEILNKLPGAIFCLGARYWHFVRDFYLWAATKSLNANVRYSAMQVFHEISLCLPSQVQSKDLAPIFVSMYFGRYPGPELLTVLSDRESYIIEPLSILENIIFIFQSLSVSTQSVFLLRLKPWIPLLIKTRFNFSKRLFSLLSYELGCYESDQIEEVVMPVAIEAIYLLTRVRSPAKELHCQRGSVTWKLVQSFLSQLAHLVVDCLHQLKPQEWPILPLEHDKMSSVRQCLEQLMRSLFNPNGVKFLRSIYHAMHKDDGLADEHLLPFITEETVKLLKQWLSEEDTEVVKN